MPLIIENTGKSQRKLEKLERLIIVKKKFKSSAMKRLRSEGTFFICRSRKKGAKTRLESAKKSSENGRISNHD